MVRCQEFREVVFAHVDNLPVTSFEINLIGVDNCDFFVCSSTLTHSSRYDGANVSSASKHATYFPLDVAIPLFLEKAGCPLFCWLIMYGAPGISTNQLFSNFT